MISAVASREVDAAAARIEDGKGEHLDRTFAVKLWPTLVMLRDGHVVARVVRPRNADEVRVALAALRKPTSGVRWRS